MRPGGDIVSVTCSLMVQKSTVRNIILEKLGPAGEAMCTFIQASPEAMLLVDEKGEIVIANRATETLFDYSPGELHCQPIERLIPKRFRKQHKQYRKVFSDTPSGRPMAAGRLLYAQRKDGSEFPVRTSLTPLPTKVGLLVVALVVDISTLRMAQRELERFFSVSLDLLCIAGFDGYFKKLNMRWEEVLGFSRQELLARPYLEFVHPDDRDSTTQETVKLGRGLETFSFENRYLCKDGSYRWLQWVATPLRSEHLIYAAARDISQEKAALKNLEESESRYKQLVENSLGLICTHDFDGLLLSVNSPAASLLGYEPDELIGKNLREVLSTEAQRFLPDYFRQLRSQASASGLMEVRGKDGSEHALEYRNVVHVNAEGGQYVLGMAIDVTRRREAEKAVRQAERQNELILDAAGDGICGLGIDGRIIFVNPAVGRLTGWEVEELIGKDQHDILHHSRRDGTPYPREECPIYAALRDGNVHREDQEVFWSKDGSSFPVEYVSTPIRGDREEIVGAVVTFRDISARLEIERMKDSLISTASHELRTPLTSIRASLSLLASGKMGPLSEKGQRLAEIGLANSERLGRLVSDFLDIEQIRAGMKIVHKQPCDIRDLVVQAVESVQESAREAGVRITYSAASTGLDADPDRLVQILVNLLGNAIKFSPEGETVELVADVRQGEVVLQVKDKGPGISQTNLERIFEPFFKVDPGPKPMGGTGLGLAICKSLIEQHGGRIWVESVVGKGSRFFVSLPLATGIETGGQPDT